MDNACSRQIILAADARGLCRCNEAGRKRSARTLCRFPKREEFFAPTICPRSETSGAAPTCLMLQSLFFVTVSMHIPRSARACVNWACSRRFQASYPDLMTLPTLGALAGNACATTAYHTRTLYMPMIAGRGTEWLEHEITVH